MQALGVSELKNLTKFDSLEAYHSIVSCELEREIVPLLESRKMRLMVFSPLAGGLWAARQVLDGEPEA